MNVTSDIHETTKTKENVEKEVTELTSEVDLFIKVAASVSLLGVVAGAIGSIVAGPVVFMIGAGLVQ